MGDTAILAVQWRRDGLLTALEQAELIRFVAQARGGGGGGGGGLYRKDHAWDEDTDRGLPELGRDS